MAHMVAKILPLIIKNVNSLEHKKQKIFYLFSNKQKVD